MKKQEKRVFVDPKNDVAFKKLFGDDNHKDLTINFLNSVLQLSGYKKIQEIKFLDKDLSAKNIKDKKNYLDVYCTDELKNNYIIEMQSLNEYNFIQRSQMYAARVLSGQLKKGGHYEDLVPVIFLGVVNYTLFEDDREIVSNYVVKNNKTNKIPRNSLLSWNYVELSKFNIKLDDFDQLKTMHDKWFYFLKYADDLRMIPESLQDFEEAFSIIEQLHWSDADLHIYNEEQDKIGRELRQQQGALLEGEDKAKRETALNLLKMGVSIEIIVQATGLSVEQIEKLQKK